VSRAYSRKYEKRNGGQREHRERGRIRIASKRTSTVNLASAANPEADLIPHDEERKPLANLFLTRIIGWLLNIKEPSNLLSKGEQESVEM
jgi:hypothetical protein